MEMQTETVIVNDVKCETFVCKSCNRIVTEPKKSIRKLYPLCNECYHRIIQEEMFDRSF